MDQFYMTLFAVVALLAALVEVRNRSGKGQPGATNPDFVKFRRNYLAVYCLMMAGDWLQGPYVYALYQHYGFSRGDIGKLFTAGFGSSMIFGTLVGSLADTHGRKAAALTYVFSYTIGCFTKHFNSFWILLIGRIFCGVATSLLYSAFESWLVAEHVHRGYSADWLGNIFSQAVFLGNGLMAIAAGLIAHALVESLAIGPVAPFDAASIVLLIGGGLIFATWNENYGDNSEKASVADKFKKAFHLITGDPKIALLGAMQSLFEGSMYTFVFLWTPALSPGGEHIPHGMVFACFMVSCMFGSAIAGKLLSDGSHFKVEKYMQGVFGVSAACLFVPVMYHHTRGATEAQPVVDGSGISVEGKIQLLAFCVFEAMVGIFWPSMMSMRAGYVPEELRSTIINFFRIPLNLFVCVVLANTSSVPLSTMFTMCGFFLVVCLGCQKYFADHLHCEKAGSHLNEDPEEDTGLLTKAMEMRGAVEK